MSPSTSATRSEAATSTDLGDLAGVGNDVNPRSTNAFTMPAPMPWEAPVTRAVLKVWCHGVHLKDRGARGKERGRAGRRKRRGERALLHQNDGLGFVQYLGEGSLELRSAGRSKIRCTICSRLRIAGRVGKRRAPQVRERLQERNGVRLLRARRRRFKDRTERDAIDFHGSLRLSVAGRVGSVERADFLCHVDARGRRCGAGSRRVAEWAQRVVRLIGAGIGERRATRLVGHAVRFEDHDLVRPCAPTRPIRKIPAPGWS